MRADSLYWSFSEYVCSVSGVTGAGIGGTSGSGQCFSEKYCKVSFAGLTMSEPSWRLGGCFVLVGFPFLMSWWSLFGVLTRDQRCLTEARFRSWNCSDWSILRCALSFRIASFAEFFR